MLDNYLYNLMIQLVEENKSLWRIKDEYIKDAEGNPDNVAYWQKLAKDKEAHVNELLELIKNHLK